jgi:uncharacterized repeat protein (TIGR01451 family)
MRNSITSIKRLAGAGLAVLLALAILFANGTNTAWAATPGTVVAWGDNLYGQASVPAGLNDVIAIAAGYYQSLALKRDGTVVAWGDNTYGQASVPAGLSDVKAIAAGAYHSLALKRDGTVVAWGRNDDGQASVPAGLSDENAIATRYYHNLALKNDGSVVGWGRNRQGQANVPAGLSDVTAIATGGSHSLALKRDGTVVAWGDNFFGQISVPAGLSDVVAVDSGAYHNLALKKDGSVVAWGWNMSGQTDIPADLSGVAAIATSSSHSLALKRDGTVVAWGDNSAGETDVPAGLNNVTAISAGAFHNLALVADTTTPAISARVAGTRGDDGWYTGDVTVSWSLVEDESSISAQSGCDSATISSDTAGTPLTCTATSTGGTLSASVTIKRDATPPSTSSRVSNGTDQATITLDASDALSGLASTSYSVNGGAPQLYSGPFTLSGAGVYTISYFSTDRAGNLEVTQTLPLTIASAPDLTIAKRHSGDFAQGQTGAQYTISVSNGGAAPTSGLVQVVDTLPTGLNATALSGMGWTCTLATLTCTRDDALAPGSSYPDITLIVTVAGNAPASLTNHASVSGGGEQNSANNSASDPTSITASAGGSGAQLVADPCVPGKLALLVSGTAGNDVIALTLVNTNQVKVVINKASVGTFTPSGLIIVLGQAGNDTITVDKKLPQARLLYGNEGNDTLDGDVGRNILIGGGGDDTLEGDDGRDILIGGAGADTLKGNDGDDILLAGSTSYDEASTSNQAVLCAIQAEWLRAEVDYDVRVAHLSGMTTGGWNGASLLKPGQTVFDDAGKDKLKGEGEQDWFLLNQTGGSAPDTHDRKGTEVAAEL